uniref:Uncharacterized protein n=1 Tax=Aegilops tauschii subsp. strangulata TaxID=200361 RepID=A0A453EMC8_AEGTS
ARPAERRGRLVSLARLNDASIIIVDPILRRRCGLDVWLFPIVCVCACVRASGLGCPAIVFMCSDQMYFSSSRACTFYFYS